MTAPSAIRKLSAAGRIASRLASRHRYSRTAWSVAQAVAKSLARAFRQLWLEITGFFFLVFAVLGGLAVYREYPALQSGEGSLARLAIIALFTIMFLWFGLSSLWRARRKT